MQLWPSYSSVAIVAVTVSALLPVLFAAHYSQFSMRKLDYDPCYQNGRPIHCIPDFINAAFGKPVVASSTCGQFGPTR
ncbi:unnamed protein product [Enterobius vermicularis]|uniref:Laminin N-terminal domain-containing protein n=1 Tax=Enterobius vermicularis TaxID=51028 RepID=A0A0N4V7T7_ENTVE|nr:unnamed protein product [Enterobius vermicularis]